MRYFVICLFLYVVLIFADILPQIKAKNFKALQVSIPIYLITLGLNFMIGLGYDFISPDYYIEELLKSFLNIK